MPKKRSTALKVSFAATCICAACSSFDSSPVGDGADAGGDGNGGIAESGVETADPREPGADVQAEAAPLPPYLLVFLSSEEHIGQFPPAVGGSVLTGLSGADAFCARLAEASPRTKGRRWVAWLSWNLTGGDARTRLARTASGDLTDEYRLVDGVTQVFPKGFNFDVLFDGGASLPTNPIKVTEQERVLGGPLPVWTGTLQNGTARQADNQCGGWNLGSPDASYGAVGTSELPSGWSYYFGTPPCTEAHHLYCFETRS